MSQRFISEVAASKLRKTNLFLPHPSIEFVTADRKGFLTHGDTLAVSEGLQTEIADIVFLNPPFNLGKKYEVARWLENGDPDAYVLEGVVSFMALF